MYEQSSTAEYGIPRIRVNDTELKIVDNFNYLCSAMSRCIRIDEEVAHQISKDSQVFGRLQNSVWNRYSLQMNTKLKRDLDLAQNRPARRREMKTGAAVYEANRIAAAKAKREARKSQMPRLLNSNTIRRSQYTHAANVHSSHKSDSLDTFEPNAPSSRQCLPLLPLSPLSQTLRRPPPPSPPTTLSLPCRHHPSCPNSYIDQSDQHHHHNFMSCPQQ
ncbi:hypothetical protein SprV_0100216600 [Sparganum proliferum]